MTRRLTRSAVLGLLALAAGATGCARTRLPSLPRAKTRAIPLARTSPSAHALGAAGLSRVRRLPEATCFGRPEGVDPAPRARLREDRLLDACTCPWASSPLASCDCATVDLDTGRVGPLDADAARRERTGLEPDRVSAEPSSVSPLELTADGRTLVRWRRAPTSDEPERHVIEVRDVASRAHLRDIALAADAASEWLAPPTVLGTTLLVSQAAERRPTTAILYEPRSGRRLARMSAHDGVVPFSVGPDVYAFVAGDGSAVEWRSVKTGAKIGSLALGETSTREVIVRRRGGAHAARLVLVQGPTAGITEIDLGTRLVVRRIPLPVCARGT